MMFLYLNLINLEISDISHSYFFITNLINYYQILTVISNYEV